jgi:hypothetical protein
MAAVKIVFGRKTGIGNGRGTGGIEHGISFRRHIGPALPEHHHVPVALIRKEII